MKTINLKNAEIKEIILQPSNGIITVSYAVKDDLGNVIFIKTTSLKTTDLPTAGETALNNLAQKLLDRIISQEGL